MDELFYLLLIPLNFIYTSNFSTTYIVKTSMTTTQKAYLQLHASVFLWGFTAILGKVILVNAILLVWWRMLITSLCLFLLVKGWKVLKNIDPKTLWQLARIGTIVALHWIGFYGSIKYANASIALVCLTSTSFFVALIEPFLLKKPMDWIDIGIGLIIIPAMMFIVSDLQIGMTVGVIFGILAALGAALFSILNKTMVNKIEPLQMTFIEIGSGWVFLSFLMPIYMYQNPNTPFIPIPMDWIYLILLSIFCTIMPYVMSLFALRHLSAFTTVLAVNLEPVYGITMAWFLLNENKELNMSFYIGVCIILCAVFAHPFLKGRLKLNTQASDF